MAKAVEVTAQNATSSSERANCATGWTASLVLAIPTNFDLHLKMNHFVTTVLQGRGPVTTSKRNRLGVTFGIECQGREAALVEASQLGDSLAACLGLPLSAVKAVKLTSNEALDAEIANLPSCIGVGEAASILGVSKQRVTQLAQRDDFPEPVFRLRSGPVYSEAEMRHFASVRRSAASPARRN